MRSIFNEVCKIKQKYNLIALVRGRELEWMRGFRGASWGGVGEGGRGRRGERGEMGRSSYQRQDRRGEERE